MDMSSQLSQLLTFLASLPEGANLLSVDEEIMLEETRASGNDHLALEILKQKLMPQLYQLPRHVIRILNTPIPDSAPSPTKRRAGNHTTTIVEQYMPIPPPPAKRARQVPVLPPPPPTSAQIIEEQDAAYWQALQDDQIQQALQESRQMYAQPQKNIDDDVDVDDGNEGSSSASVDSADIPATRPFPEEPPLGVENGVLIVVAVLPNGQRESRRFWSANHTVADVKLWLRTTISAESVLAQTFSCCSMYPRAVFDPDQSLQSCQPERGRLLLYVENNE